MTETLKLPVLPLSDSVVLPGMVVPLRLDEAEIQSAVDAAGSADRKVLVVPRLDGKYAAIGTVAVLEQVGRLPSGEKAAVVRGETRAQIGSGVTGPGAALWVEATLVPDQPVTGRMTELAKEYKALVVGILQQRGAWQVIDSVQQITDPGQLADTAGYASYLDLEHKAQLLAETDVRQAARAASSSGRKEHVAEQEVTEKISQDVREGMEKTQREFLLRQQLAAIRKELGEGEPDGSDDYRARVEAADLPEHVRKAALTRGRQAGAGLGPEPGGGLDPHLARHGPRHAVERAHDRRRRPDRRPRRARRRPRRPRRRQGAHHRVPRRARPRRERKGMEKVGGRGSGAVLALVGPPGVGKTSLGESVARALGRKFVRVALGGVRDEAEIRGHRRTYVGALPGRIVRAIREAGSMNPVVLLDEIDKVGSDFRGDPTAALLEVLDPAQNHTFRDHYLEVDLDLSDVLFLATANVFDTIPGPLLDRMEVVTLDGYTEEEKVAIARDHLLPRQIEKAGPGAVRRRLLRRGARHDRRRVHPRGGRAAAGAGPGEGPAQGRRVAGLGHGGADPRRRRRPGQVPGTAEVHAETAERTSTPGVATGLAVTGAGGDVLFIEATSMDGDPGLILTGQLGDVMKESARSRCPTCARAGRPATWRARSCTSTCPRARCPKDGPSAGITMTTALASLASGRPVKSSVGMTGEVTLQGKVLPIGGVKQKLLAAHRAGLTEVIIPKRNEPDLDDLPESVRGELRIHPVSDVADVLALALEPVPGHRLTAIRPIATGRPSIGAPCWRIRGRFPGLLGSHPSARRLA